MATRDMRMRANQLFAALVGLYALQSLMLCLRWGYGIEPARFWIGLVAPMLPVCGYLAYLSLSNRLTRQNLWPLAIVALNWVVLIIWPDFADPFILMTYFSFGVLILRFARAGSDVLPLARINAAPGALRAMVLTGSALIASAMTDLYVIYDFITNEGQSVGLIVTFMQTFFILLIGFSAVFGHPSAEEDEESVAAAPMSGSEEDTLIVARLTKLFETEELHKNEDLSLRRLSRRLGLPDRSVSGAINRIKGVNVSQFVNEFRIKEACKLLTETDQSILQISLTAGFSTKSNFNREFSRITGQTPSTWRQGKS